MNDGSAAAHLEWARSQPREFDLISAQAQVAAFGGRLREAGALYGRAADMATARSLTGTASGYWAHLALTEALYRRAAAGRCRKCARSSRAPRARRRARARSRASAQRSRSAWSGLGVGCPRAGDARPAAVSRVDLDAHRARAERRGGHRPRRGAPGRWPSARLEAASRPSSERWRGWCPPSCAARRISRAATRRRRAPSIRKCSTIAARDPFAPVDPAGAAGTGAGVAAWCGDAAKSRPEYDELLRIWKEADPDLLPLQRARAERDGARDRNVVRIRGAGDHETGPDHAAPQPGDTIAHYRLLERLGRDNDTTIYRATGPDARARRRGQAAGPGARRQRHGARALQARGAHRLARQPPAHLRRPRLRRGERPGVHRVRAARRAVRWTSCSRQARLHAGPPPGSRPSTRRRRRGGAPPRPGARQHQALERLRHRRWTREAAGARADERLVGNLRTAGQSRQLVADRLGNRVSLRRTPTWRVSTRIVRRSTSPVSSWTTAATSSRSVRCSSRWRPASRPFRATARRGLRRRSCRAPPLPRRTAHPGDRGNRADPSQGARKGAGTSLSERRRS